MIYTVKDFLNDLVGNYDQEKNNSEIDNILSNRNQPDQIYNDIKACAEGGLEYTPLKAPKIKKFVPYIWDKEKFLYSYYQEKYISNKRKQKYLIKMQMAEKEMSFRNVKPTSLSKELTHLDYKIIRLVHPTELLDYDGTDSALEKCKWLTFWMKKNQTLENLVFEETSRNRKTIKYFIEVALELDKLQNYNSMQCIIDGLRKNNLDTDDFNALSGLVAKTKDYFAIRKLITEKMKNNELFVCPLNVIQKSLLELNANVASQTAANNFCDVIQFFIGLQQGFYKMEKSNKIEHFLYHKLVVAMNIKSHMKVSKMTKKELGSFFLFL
ncbi:hypothetical protein EDEG_02351 [Edhazardia aedis USNM 41457]|uniref:Ras-GEF domain-containing protein n=1 Tax=Edhazardia aedis (strain USNM 41457) TaxID=1003232 RepID=J9DL11_EDHAE|nr:hypothetical protein EDEG_02351 [Edhazardia aedis USNM 41457]|eukprot:EJW03285.1 hypothetical protein EDEG_02351 [Edhazardia aedis USNM 41457]